MPDLPERRLALTPAYREIGGRGVDLADQPGLGKTGFPWPFRLVSTFWPQELEVGTFSAVHSSVYFTFGLWTPPPQQAGNVKHGGSARVAVEL
jgi:hypothetical protein